MIRIQRPLQKLLALFIIWRVALFGVGIMAGEFLSYRPDFAYTAYSFYLNAPLTGIQKSIEPWANFDGVHYLNIARRGYVDEVRFFPLLPLLISGLSFGNEQAVLVVGFLLTHLILFLALYWLYKLLLLDHSKSDSFKTICFLLAFPTSFFLGGVYTEGLFLLLSVLSLYSARKQWWGRAIFFVALASATRVTGVVLIPVLLIELWLQNKKQFFKEWKKILLIGFGASGLVLYALYLWKYFNDPLLFLKAHTLLGNSRSMGLVNPLQTGFRYLKILVSLSPKIYEWWIALLEVGVFCVTSVFLFLSWRMNIHKSYWWFAFLAFVIPALSGTFTGMPRYVLPLFPLFLPIVLAKPKWLFIVYLIAAIPWLLMFTVLFLRGYFIA